MESEWCWSGSNPGVSILDPGFGFLLGSSGSSSAASQSAEASVSRSTQREAVREPTCTFVCLFFYGMTERLPSSVVAAFCVTRRGGKISLKRRRRLFLIRRELNVSEQLCAGYSFGLRHEVCFSLSLSLHLFLSSTQGHGERCRWTTCLVYTCTQKLNRKRPEMCHSDRAK